MISLPVVAAVVAGLETAGQQDDIVGKKPKPPSCWRFPIS